jgi:hypothetical protein
MLGIPQVLCKLLNIENKRACLLWEGCFARLLSREAPRKFLIFGIIVKSINFSIMKKQKSEKYYLKWFGLFFLAALIGFFIDGLTSGDWVKFGIYTFRSLLGLGTIYIIDLINRRQTRKID